MFNPFKPTAQMLGRWQPWHKGHTTLFKKALLETGQVCIMIRTVPQDEDASGGRTMVQDDNPFTVEQVIQNIKNALLDEGFKYNEEYTIMTVPNIVDISYGRGVGYTFTQHDLGEDIHNISATKIRAQLRAEGKLD
jgi:nicotinic acid mononucleotide adenylyltransferase